MSEDALPVAADDPTEFLGLRPFLDAIDLVDLGDDDGRVFLGVTQPVPWPKSYGGDLVTQAAAAAMRTVDGDRALHASHTVFVAPAPVGGSVRYEVFGLRDGRSYSSRAVIGTVDGAAVVTSMLSFHVGEDGEVLAPPMPAVPAPQTLPSAAELLAGDDSPAARYWRGGRAFDLRHVDGARYRQPVQPEPPAGDGAVVDHVWVRPFEALPDDPDVHRLALLYVSDYTILEPVLRRQGRSWRDAGLVTASLDHAMWLHGDVRVDDWVLTTQTTESIAQSRGLVSATMHAADGRHLATVAQQGMIRDRSTAPAARETS